MDAKNQSQLMERAKAYSHNADVNGLPKDAYLQITDKCNCRCVMCDIWKQKSAHPPARKIFDIIHRLRDLDFKWVTLWGGEPFLHPSVIGIMREVKICCLKLQFITNGTVLDGDKLHAVHEYADNVVFSIDGPNAEIHDIIRGVKGIFTRAIPNARALVQLNEADGKGPGIELDTTVTSHNIDWLEAMIDFSKQFGDILVDYDPAQIQGVGNSNDGKNIIIPPCKVDAIFNSLIERAQQGAHITSPAKLELIRKYLKKEPIDGACYSLFKDLLITPDGNVPFCWGDSKVTGNILEPRFEEKWKRAIAGNVGAITGSTDRCSQCGFSHARWPDSGYAQIVERANAKRKIFFDKLAAALKGPQNF